MDNTKLIKTGWGKLRRTVYCKDNLILHVFLDIKIRFHTLFDVAEGSLKIDITWSYIDISRQRFQAISKDNAEALRILEIKQR